MTEASFTDGVLTIRRIYDAPRGAVFEAWVETAKVERWWGCDQTTKVCSTVEPKVGGAYRHVMTIAGAGEYPSDGVFTEFSPPERLAFRTRDAHSGQTMEVSVDFIERGRQTEIVLRHRGLPTELKEIVTGGWGAAFEKLDRLLMEDAGAV